MAILSGLFKRLFQRKLIIYVTLRENQFCLAFMVGNKTLTYEEALRYPILNKYLRGAKTTSKEFTFSIPIQNAHLLYEDMKNNMLQGMPVELKFSERTSNLIFKRCEDEIIFNYYLDTDRGCLWRKLPNDVIQIGAYYYLQGNIIWVLEENELAVLKNHEKLVGGNITKIIKYTNLNHINLDISIATDKLILITGESIENKGYQLKLTYQVPREKWKNLNQLEEYILVNQQLYKKPEEALLKSFCQGNESIILEGGQLPQFVSEFRQSIIEFCDEKTRKELEDDKVFIANTDIHLVLKCECEMKNGVGIAKAIPVIQYHGSDLDINDLLKSKEQGYINIQNKWLSEGCLRAMGISELGRFVDGTPIAPIVVRPAEVINRGSERLGRLASTFVLNDQDWLAEGSIEEIFRAHMRFLRKYGINGGVVVDREEDRVLMLVKYLKGLLAQVKEARIIILMKKSYIEEVCTRENVQDITIFRGVKDEKTFRESNKNVVLTAYNMVGNILELTANNWDIVIMLEPDEAFKTNTSVLFKNTNSLKGRLRLGIFKERLSMYSEGKLEAICQLFKLDKSISSKVIRSGDKQTLPNAYNRKEITGQEEGAKIIIEGEEETDLPIDYNSYSFRGEGRFNITIREGYRSSGEAFKRKAQENANVEGRKATLVPFMSYWPTYDSMTQAQLRWYFYWRREVRVKNYMNTDLSYIFVYIYELINGIGYRNKEEGYKLLIDVWKAYRNEFPKLDHYLIDWTLDYIMLHQLEHHITELIEDDLNLEAGPIYNMYLYKQYINTSNPITQNDILTIMSYKIKKSKFYIAGYGEQLLNEITRIVNIIDESIRKEYGKGILEFFSPKEKVAVRRSVYISAVYAGNETYQLEYFAFTKHMPLIEFMDAIAKQVENRLRQKNAFNGRLRGIDMETSFIKIIDSALGIETDSGGKQFTKREQIVKPRIVTIDINKVQGLRVDADEVRKVLESQELQEEGNQQREETMTIEINQVGTENNINELEEMRKCIEKGPEDMLSVLKVLWENNWECSKDEMQGLLKGQMIEAIIDEINGRMIEVISIPLIVVEGSKYIIEDDFREEIEQVLNTIGQQIPVLKEDIGESQEVFSVMEDRHLEILKAITSQENVEKKVQNIAVMNNTMPELLIDEINELFSEYIGDLLVDTSSEIPSILEEYQEMLNQYLNKVGRNI